MNKFSGMTTEKPEGLKQSHDETVTIDGRPAWAKINTAGGQFTPTKPTYAEVVSGKAVRGNEILLKYYVIYGRFCRDVVRPVEPGRFTSWITGKNSFLLLPREGERYEAMVKELNEAGECKFSSTVRDFGNEKLCGLKVLGRGGARKKKKKDLPLNRLSSMLVNEVLLRNEGTQMRKMGRMAARTALGPVNAKQNKTRKKDNRVARIEATKLGGKDGEGKITFSAVTQSEGVTKIADGFQIVGEWLVDILDETLFPSQAYMGNAFLKWKGKISVDFKSIVNQFSGASGRYYIGYLQDPSANVPTDLSRMTSLSSAFMKSANIWENSGTVSFNIDKWLYTGASGDGGQAPGNRYGGKLFIATDFSSNFLDGDTFGYMCVNTKINFDQFRVPVSSSSLSAMYVERGTCALGNVTTGGNAIENLPTASPQNGTLLVSDLSGTFTGASFDGMGLGLWKITLDLSLFQLGDIIQFTLLMVAGSSHFFDIGNWSGGNGTYPQTVQVGSGLSTIDSPIDNGGAVALTNNNACNRLSDTDLGDGNQACSCVYVFNLQVVDKTGGNFVDILPPMYISYADAGATATVRLVASVVGNTSVIAKQQASKPMSLEERSKQLHELKLNDWSEA